MSGRLVQLVLPANGASAPFTHTVSFAAAFCPRRG